MGRERYWNGHASTDHSRTRHRTPQSPPTEDAPHTPAPSPPEPPSQGPMHLPPGAAQVEAGRDWAGVSIGVALVRGSPLGRLRRCAHRPSGLTSDLSGRPCGFDLPLGRLAQ
ncbi:hypothetical protein FXF65_38585 [Actinomadura syzygii]|uniref:Uncharacterized protein n=2 Tax=Actinomadura syzygii TaxID=1427538 RepID=A0A5D0TPK4_9ACTN|nr:hypothetical protein FXF65_38585 [Actinomadura syzygii]